jgi:uncharacterized membrane protein
MTTAVQTLLLKTAAQSVLSVLLMLLAVVLPAFAPEALYQCLAIIRADSTVTSCVHVSSVVLSTTAITYLLLALITLAQY